MGVIPVLVFAAAFGLSGSLAKAQDRNDCDLASGLQARIAKIESVNVDTAYAHVERAGRTFDAGNNCFLRGGDIVGAGPGIAVTLIMPTGEIATASATHSVLIPSAHAPSWTDRMISIFREIAGGDIEEARSMANAYQARTRNWDRSVVGRTISIAGLSTKKRQKVMPDLPLLIRWSGGAVPYSIVVSDEVSLQARTYVANTSFFELSSSQLPARNFKLTIKCTGCRPLVLSLGVARKDRLPSISDVQLLSDQEERNRLEAVWLLTRGTDEWRLEALSLLQYQARYRNDLVAQSILATD